MHDLNIRKRNGSVVPYDDNHIKESIMKASKDAQLPLTKHELSDIIFWFNREMEKDDDRNPDILTTNAIEAKICRVLNQLSDKYKHFVNILNAYKSYQRFTKTNKIEDQLLLSIEKAGGKDDRNSVDVNANVGTNFGAKLLNIASVANKSYNLAKIPNQYAKGHIDGDYHIHDLDSFNLAPNCLNIPLGEKLMSGFNSGYGTLRPCKRIESAVNVACIIYQCSQNNLFGGQGCTDLSNDLAPFVKMTREEIKKQIIEFNPIFEDATLLVAEELEWFEKKVEDTLLKRVEDSMHQFLLNLNTMHSRSGSQIVFSSVNIGTPHCSDADMIDKAILKGYCKGFGKGEQFIFPNLLYRVKNGINKKEGDQYYETFKLACDVASKRMNPTFINCDSPTNLPYYERGLTPAYMGCRTSIMANCNGPDGSEGRGNNAPTTINLPKLAILANEESDSGDVIETFFKKLDEQMYKCRDIMKYRRNVLEKLKVRELPFSVGEKLMKGSENLSPDDSIAPVLDQGTWGIGFIGLAETLTALIGSHHGETDHARRLGLSIVKRIRSFCDEYREKDKMNWCCYATPAEGLSGRFTPMDKKLFGVISGVNDKDYYTNSFHVPVSYDISIQEKMEIEGEYHKLCNGGHISYVELDGSPSGEVVENIVTAIFDTTDIAYMGLNFHIRYCKDCGANLNSQQSKCPKCESYNIQGVSRVTGYLSLDERFGPGKRGERKDRVSHIGKNKSSYTFI